MPQTMSGPSTEIRRRLLDRVHARYDERAKSARLLFAGVQGFALLSLLLVLLPFASLRRQQRAAEAHLGAAEAEARLRTREAKAYERAANSLTALTNAIQEGPQELKKRLENLAKERKDSRQTSSVQREPSASIMQRPIQQSDQSFSAQARSQVQGPIGGHCESFDADSVWAMCVVRETLDAQYSRYAALLDTGVVAPLSGLESSPLRPDSPGLVSALAELKPSIERRVAATPRFWERFEGKQTFYDSLRADLDESWERFHLRDSAAALAKASVAAESTRAQLATRRERLAKREAELSARLAALDSPLGKLPVGVLDAIQIFPILLTVGLVLWALTARDASRLRGALIDGYRELDPEGTAAWMNDLDLVAPRDPGLPAVGGRGPWPVALLFPVAVFLVGCAVALYSWTAVPDEAQPPRAERIFYSTLYVLCAVALWRVVHAVVTGARPVAPTRAA